VGRPLLYGTTPDFLSYMGVNELADLPELKELGSVLEERERVHGEIEDAATEDAPRATSAPEASAESPESPVTEAAPAEEAMSPEGAA
jgi:segregation and condensation protein B